MQTKQSNLILCAFIFLSACSTAVKDSAPTHIPIDVMAVPDAVPRYETRRASNARSYEIFGKRYYPLQDEKGFRQQGLASWYGKKFHGRQTANGETYDMFAMTAAHKTLPIPSYLRVTNKDNGRSVVVRVNDRGPFHANRIVDLSYTAAAQLDILKKGTGWVEIVAITPNDNKVEKTTKIKQPAEAAAMDNKNLYLQIGAFSDQLNAMQLQQKLETMALTAARLKVSSMNGVTLYKVQLGPMNSLEEATQMDEHLAANGIFGTKVVHDE